MIYQKIKPLLKPNSHISLSSILQASEKSSFGFLLALFALPSALPIPAPGYSIPFGIMIVSLGIQMLLNKKTPWLPAMCKNWQIKVPAKQVKIDKLLKFISFFEKFIRTRFKSLFLMLYPLLGVIIILAGTSMLIPIPGTNTLPALGVFLISLGVIEEDAIATLLGILVSLTGIFVTISILVIGKEAFQFMFNNFLGLL